MELVGHLHVFRYRDQRLEEGGSAVRIQNEMRQVRGRREAALTSRAALASSHFSARPEMVMMSHLRGTKSSGLTSPFSCRKAS